MERYICIHGHFYQPPRENPWLEAIEIQDSAYPYHDWNERITAECYGPNAAARMLDGNQIVRIVNNYAHISFNFGPTLLQWIEQFRPDVYQAILAADRESRQLYGGHGSALAQAYNHMILPLANRRDKHTQTFWGICDFRHRFGRDPEGMWLPETAVDAESLNVMAELGIRFTVLSPYQAHRVRPLGARHWQDVSGGRVDPSTAYTVHLRSGREIIVFFYDGPISRAVAFEDLLVKGEFLAERLRGAFSDERGWPQLVHIATDGETYGHHRKGGEMGLAYALQYIENEQIARLTNYGEFLEKHPPSHEAQILENTSWSCAHGVDRWRADCGCSSGGRAGWNQRWRGPLRAALDWLRDAVAPAYYDHARRYLHDPWEARNQYVDVVLDRSPAAVDRYFQQHERRPLGEPDRVHALKLLELQRHSMLMYTSCGWFFDELSGLESVQVLQYAGRVLQLARDVLDADLEPEFLTRLAEARSNLPEHSDGRQVYDKLVRPAMVDLHKVGAHYAVSSLFEDYPDRARVFCYDVERHDSRSLAAGKVKLAHGRVTVHSTVTLESASMSFGVLHLGEHTIAGGVRDLPTEDGYYQFQEQIASKFERGDLPDVLHDVFERFGAGAYSLKLLFRDAQRRILSRILESSLSRAEASYRHIYETEAPLLTFLRAMQVPLPSGFRMAAEFVLNTDLRKALEQIPPDTDRVRSLLEEAVRIGTSLDQPTLEYALRGSIETLARDLGAQPRASEQVQRLNDAVRLARSLPFPVDLWTAQNIVHEIKLRAYPEMLLCAEQGDPQAGAWSARFRELADNLSLRID